jgi:hypothetical protein
MSPEDVRQIFNYDPDTGHLYWRERKQGRKFGSIGTPDSDGYLVIWMNNRKKRFPVHRIIWAFSTGKWPNDQIDHINGVKNDNRLSNLREANTAQNMRNVGKQSHNTSGFKGVSWHKLRSKWRSDIKVNQKQIFLGLFNSPEEAHSAYCEAARKLHGDFAREA